MRRPSSICRARETLWLELPGDLGGHADRERAGRDVARDVRVRGDDRLGADAAAGVDHRTETDLRTILQHDRREAVLEALEQRMADVVRDDQRAHRQEDLPADEHRPADVDERLVPDEGEIADREHRPRVAMTASSEPDRPAGPDARAEERAPAEELEICAELARLSDCDDLLAADRRPRADLDAVLDDDLRRRDQRALAEDDALADLGAVLPQDRDLLVGRQEAERIRVRAKTLEEAWGRVRPCSRRDRTRRAGSRSRSRDRRARTRLLARQSPSGARSAPRRPSR